MLRITTHAHDELLLQLNATADIDNYWIRAVPNAGTTSTDGGLNSAILRYSGAAEIEPTTNATTSVLALNETDLIPLEDLTAPGTAEVGGVDYALNLDFSFDGTDFYINGDTFTSPTVPVLLQILSGSLTASELLPNGSVYVIPANSTVEISFPMTANAPGQPHPFHLHGVSTICLPSPALFAHLASRPQHKFWVVRSAGSDTYNYVNPPQRDVVSTGTKIGRAHV